MSLIRTRMLLPFAVAFGCATTANLASSVPPHDQRNPADSVNLMLSRRVMRVDAPPHTSSRAERIDADSRFRVQRFIGTDEQQLFVGDTTPLILAEFECEYDLCHLGNESLSDSGWTLSDRRLARLLPGGRRSARLIYPQRASRMIVALRPGRLVVRARGVHGPLDAALESSVRSFDLERTLLILPKPRK